MEHQQGGSDLSSFEKFDTKGRRKQKDNMSFWDYFLEAYTDNYADFNGRARRKEYWSFQLITLFFMVIVFGFIIGGLAFAESNNFYVPDNVGIVSLAVMLISMLFLVIPNISVTVRRLHDIGLSGWFFLLSFLPFGSLVLFVMSLLSSQKDANNYGPPPK